jgi:hypothetical protein
MKPFSVARRVAVVAPPRLAAVLALCALVLAGCGHDRAGEPPAQATAEHLAQSSDEQQVRARTQSFLVAMRSRQDARACGLMTDSLQHGITFSLERNAERGSCETRAAHIYSSATSPGHPGARITALGLDSADASVSVVAPGGIESQIQLRRVTGAWKIANF